MWPLAVLPCFDGGFGQWAVLQQDYKGHPGERPPWWRTTLMRDHPDEKHTWWQNTHPLLRPCESNRKYTSESHQEGESVHQVYSGISEGGRKCTSKGRRCTSECVHQCTRKRGMGGVYRRGRRDVCISVSEEGIRCTSGKAGRQRQRKVCKKDWIANIGMVGIL